MNATLVMYQKFRHAAGVVEIVVWRVGLPIDPSLHQFKYRLVYVLDGARIVGYDNERGKGDHKHLGLAEVAYNFVDVQTLLADFWNDVEEMT